MSSPSRSADGAQRAQRRRRRRPARGHACITTSVPRSRSTPSTTRSGSPAGPPRSAVSAIAGVRIDCWSHWPPTRSPRLRESRADRRTARARLGKSLRAARDRSSPARRAPARMASRLGAHFGGGDLHREARDARRLRDRRVTSRIESAAPCFSSRPRSAICQRSTSACASGAGSDSQTGARRARVRRARAPNRLGRERRARRCAPRQEGSVPASSSTRSAAPGGSSSIASRGAEPAAAAAALPRRQRDEPGGEERGEPDDHGVA